MAVDVVFAENAALQTLNTFGIAANARYLAQPETLDALREVLQRARLESLPLLVLGGGSNIVLSGDFPGLVVRPCLRGIRLLGETDAQVQVAVAGGEVWHEFVIHSLKQGWFGLENLSLIPGTVGAAPVQNIGAYGVELQDVMESLLAMDIATGELHEFSREACRFAYRDSVFKQELRDRYIIVEVRFCLSRKPALKTAYGDIRQELQAMGVEQPAPWQVSEAVIAIRRRKLPDPALIGNAGSFFKNPVVPVSQFESLRQHFPGIVAYTQADGVKLAAGWLIDQAGWKGRRIGPVGTYDKQALVLVNHGGASGADVLEVAAAIQHDVAERFGVQLDMEPRVY